MLLVAASFVFSQAVSPPPPPPPFESRPCSSCDAGDACGICLMAVAEHECPSGWQNTGLVNGMGELKPGCTGLAVGEMCEADGECGTNNELKNCDAVWSALGGRDVYRREECTITTPRAPPPSPTAPLVSCDTLTCDAGASCGKCLQKLAENDPLCPAGWVSDVSLHTCDTAKPGEFCEANGECGTVEVNNCAGLDVNGRRLFGSITDALDNLPSNVQDMIGGSAADYMEDALRASDVYRVVPCLAPPAPPPPPPIQCESCAAGASCGVCLTPISEDECPEPWKTNFVLKRCDIALPGELCEGDGECGTSNALDNCRGSDEDPTSVSGLVNWRKRRGDVYSAR